MVSDENSDESEESQSSSSSENENDEEEGSDNDIRVKDHHHRKKHEDKINGHSKRKADDHRSNSKQDSSSPEPNGLKIDEDRIQEESPRSSSKSKTKPTIPISDEIDSSKNHHHRKHDRKVNGHSKRKGHEHRSSSKQDSSSPDHKKPKFDDCNIQKENPPSSSKSKTKPSLTVEDEIHSSKNHDHRKHESKANGHSKRKDHEHRSSSKQDLLSPDHRKPKHDENKIQKEDPPCSSSKSKTKPSIPIADEIDSSSGVKFEELLGCLDTSIEKVSKRSSSKKESRDKSSKQAVIPSSSSGSSKKDDKSKLSPKRHKHSEKETKNSGKHLESIIPPTHNISPNYKPSAAAALLARSIAILPPRPTTHLAASELCNSANSWDDSRHSLGNNTQERNSEDALSSILSSRNQR
jgi:hypothetical protein